jgi:hypothetical protein
MVLQFGIQRVAHQLRNGRMHAPLHFQDAERDMRAGRAAGAMYWVN